MTINKMTVLIFLNSNHHSIPLDEMTLVGI